MDVLHKCVDIGAGLGAEIEMVGMLVHVERQDRHAAGEAVCMVRSPLDRQPIATLRPDEQGPSGTAGLRLGASHELGTPCGDAAKVALHRRGEIASGITRATEPIEIDLMQDRRIGGDQLFALQPVDVEDRSRAPVKLVQSPFDGIQAANGTAVIVLVVAR